MLAVGASAAPTKHQAAVVKLGFITKFPVDFYFTLVNAAKKWDKATPGAKVIYATGKSGTDDAGEIAAIQNMIAQGVKGIAITPTSPAVVACARQGDQGRHQGRADGQRHPEVEEEELRRRDQQLRRRPARRQVPRDEAEGGRQRRRAPRQPGESVARASG